jgi:hypothetical protein
MNRETFADHNWIADVLSDIDEYAAKNNLRRLQAMVAETRIVARDEIARRGSQSNFDAVMAVLYPNNELDVR